MHTQYTGSKNCCCGGAGKTSALLINNKHSVCVAIKGETQVKTTTDYTSLQISLVCRLNGISRVIRERSIQFWIHDFKLNHGQTFKHNRNDESAHAVCGVRHNFHGRDGIHVNERHHVIGELLQHVTLRECARSGNWRGTFSTEHRLCSITNGGKTGVYSHGARTRQTELDAVVLRRIMRCGEHGARSIERTCSEIHQVCTGKAEIHHIRPTRHSTFSKRMCQRFTSDTHIARHKNGVFFCEVSEGNAQSECHFIVHLIRSCPPHVIGLDNCVKD